MIFNNISDQTKMIIVVVLLILALRYCISNDVLKPSKPCRKSSKKSLNNGVPANLACEGGTCKLPPKYEKFTGVAGTDNTGDNGYSDDDAFDKLVDKDDGRFNLTHTLGQDDGEFYNPADTLKRNDPAGTDAGDDPQLDNDDDEIRQKFINRNTAVDGYKHSQYSKGVRGNEQAIENDGGVEISPSEWEQYYVKSNNLVGSKELSRDKFSPLDDNDGKYAACNYRRESCKQKPEEIFNVDKLLPKETRDDWFDVMPEPISVKNRHLINVTRPIGVNTIGTSLRNPSHDLRGTEPCPKYVVSPWLQSSIEPDTNLKSFC